MSTLATTILWIRAQEVLPPPPEPTGSPDIDAVRVIGVVLVSLGIIVLLALALRPFVVRAGKPTAPADPTDEPDADADAGELSSFGAGSIIQFPKRLGRDTVTEPPVWDEHQSAVAERLERVVGEGNRRRKLGDRQPERTPHDLAAAALHRVAPDTRERSLRVSGESARTILPWRGVANGTDGQPFDDSAPGGIGSAPNWGSRFARTNEPATDPTPEFYGEPVRGWPMSEHDDPLVGSLPAVDHGRADDLATDVAKMERDAADDLHAAVYMNGHSATEPPPFTLDIPFGDQSGRESEPAGGTGQRIDETFPAAQIGFEDAPGYAAPWYSDAATDSGDRENVADRDAIDTPTLAALHQVVRELIYCANSGQLLHGFALYSDPFLFRFMDGSGMTESEFRDTYGSVGARPRNEWDHLDRLYDVVRLADGRIEATASYVDGTGHPSNGIERYRFVLVDGAWQIDDISPADASA